MLCLGIAALLAVGQSTTGRITVHVDQPGAKISPVFYGLMTEEINHAYDGGLYGELLRDHAFRDPAAWTPIGAVMQPTGLFMRASDGPGRLIWPTDTVPKLENKGFWGVPVKPRTTYRVVIRAKASGETPRAIGVALESEDGKTVYAKGMTSRIGSEWRDYTVTLRTSVGTDSLKNRFVIFSDQAGTIELQYVSLMGPTFHNRPNGNRPDLMQKMGDLNPAFLRLPGGNYLEGNTIAERFDWKKTIGPLEDRPGHQCPWGYWSTDGMGLLEFLEWCEDLHMQPLLAVFAGYALQQQHAAPGKELQPFVQDALDEIEYVTGDVHTKWGAIRAKNGHPRPFPLNYVEIGNEDQFDRSRSYDGRFAQFYDAIKAKYPKLQLIATMPVESRRPDIVDDHYYRSASDMERDAHHYDKYDRKGPKIFVGEWASTEGNPTPTMQAALGDAAWLTGLERNADHVVMEAYAPLLVNVNKGAAQWGTNLIGYDASTSFGSPSFYVQSMFGKNTGDTILPTDVDVPKIGPKADLTLHGGIGLGTYQTDSEYKDIEVTDGTKTLYKHDFATGLGDWKATEGDWKIEDGAYRQSGNGQDTHAAAGSLDWTNYTYHLKAKKLGGSEGFMILFHVHDGETYWQWNVGGWQNTRTRLQRHENGSVEEVGRSSNATVETGKWYDIRIEVDHGQVRCYLDNALISTAREVARPQPDPVYAIASRDRNGEIILKVVNVSDRPRQIAINLTGVSELSSTATGWILAGDPQDVNTVKEPVKVAPKRITINDAANSFSHEFPAHSVTVLRLKPKS